MDSRGEPDPHLAVGLGRHLEIADLDADDAGLLAEGLLAARAGGLHDIGRGALGEPQHVGGEGGIERVADPDHHGHAADDLIVLGDPVERACALRLVLQFFEARRGAGVIGREQFRIVAAMGEAGLGLGDGGALRRGDEAELDRSLADRLGEDLVVGGKLLDLLAQARQRLGVRPEAQSVGGRHAVGLGKHHVEADHGRAAGGELVHQIGEHRARPGPLADRFQRVLVDVDDAHRESGIEGARADALIGVEHERPQPRDRAGIPDAQGKRGDDDRPHDEDIEETRTHPLLDFATWKTAPDRREKPEPSQWRWAAPVSCFPSRTGR